MYFELNDSRICAIIVHYFLIYQQSLIITKLLQVDQFMEHIGMLNLRWLHLTALVHHCYILYYYILTLTLAKYTNYVSV